MKQVLPRYVAIVVPILAMVVPWAACGDSATGAPESLDGSSHDAPALAMPGPDGTTGETSVATTDTASDAAQIPTDAPPAGADASLGAALVADGPASYDLAIATRGGVDGAAATCNLDGGPVTLVRLSPQELKTILASSGHPYLFNVKGTTIPNIPGTDGIFASDATGVERFVGGNRCADIIVYCRSGVISQQVSAKLIADGYRYVRDLTGGILAWQAAGYPTD